MVRFHFIPPPGLWFSLSFLSPGQAMGPGMALRRRHGHEDIRGTVQILEQPSPVILGHHVSVTSPNTSLKDPEHQAETAAISSGRFYGSAVDRPHLLFRNNEDQP